MGDRKLSREPRVTRQCYWNPAEVIRKVAAVGCVSERQFKISIYKKQACHLVSSGETSTGTKRSENEVDHTVLPQSNVTAWNAWSFTSCSWRTARSHGSYIRHVALVAHSTESLKEEVQAVHNVQVTLVYSHTPPSTQLVENTALLLLFLGSTQKFVKGTFWLLSKYEPTTSRH